MRLVWKKLKIKRYLKKKKRQKYKKFLQQELKEYYSEYTK